MPRDLICREISHNMTRSVCVSDQLIHFESSYAVVQETLLGELCCCVPIAAKSFDGLFTHPRRNTSNANITSRNVVHWWPDMIEFCECGQFNLIIFQVPSSPEGRARFGNQGRFPANNHLLAMQLRKEPSMKLLVCKKNVLQKELHKASFPFWSH